MEDFHPHNDEMTFNTEEAHNIIKECIEGVLGKADYNHDSINQWTAAIVEQSLSHLVKLGKTYKYIVTCAVMQKCGAGLHTASSCFWDTTTDDIKEKKTFIFSKQVTACASSTRKCTIPGIKSK
uniref:Dynein light chain Tctex-type 3 n=1 Tax=Anolis carolinensis TaxID=28377 RepID=A0A803SLA5_ANOCA